MPTENIIANENFYISILIVEDDPLFRRYLATLVDSLGYAYTVIDDPYLVLDSLASGDFNIIIANLYISGFPGLNILQTITENYPGRDVILITSDQDNYTLTEVIARGAVDYLAKPFSLDEARAKLNRLVRERKLIHELVVENRKRLHTEAELRKSHVLLEHRVLERTRKLEEATHLAEAAIEAQSEFIANISHELRTPLHGILSFARLGKSKINILTKEKIFEYFTSITESGERLYSLLSNLLDLSKLEASMMDYEFECHCLYTTIIENTTIIRAAAEEKRVNISSCNDVQNGSICLFDKGKIGQVVQNLLINAVRYSPEDTNITVQLAESKSSFHNKYEQKKYFIISIIDQGFGIPESELDHIFDKFKQSSRTKSGAGGTGLGLAICKQIIQDHKGRIWAENLDNGGAKFSFILPSIKKDERESNFQK